MAFDKDAFLTALDSMSVMELNDPSRPSKRSSACPPRRWPPRPRVVAAPPRRPPKSRPSSPSSCRSRREQGVGHQGRRELTGLGLKGKPRTWSTAPEARQGRRQ